MDATGEVIWEVRPQNQEVWDTAMKDAKRLNALKAASAKNPDDAVLAANVALLDAKGRGQRAKPDMAELEKHAAVKGVEADLLEAFMATKAEEKINAAVASARSDGGAAAYALWKAGGAPAADQRTALGFYRYSVDGAIGAGDKSGAKELLALFQKAGEASNNPRMKERVATDVAELTKKIEAMN